MNAKALGIVAALAIVVGGAAVVTSSRERASVAPGAGTSSAKSSASAETSKKMFPKLDKEINAATYLHIADAASSITLTKAGEEWIVQTTHGYPAKLDEIRRVLMGLGKMEKLEEKTSNPASYTRVDVEDMSTEGAKGKFVEVKKGEETLAAVILGQTQWPQGGGDPAQFVRVPTEKTTWLVSNNLSPNTTSQTWLKTEVANVPANRLKSVTIEHADGERVEVTKDSETQTNFALQTIPEGREVKTESVANELGNALVNLRLEDVIPADQVTTAPLATATVRAFDGLSVVARAFDQNGTKCVKLEASVAPEEIAALNAARQAKYDEEKKAHEEAIKAAGEVKEGDPVPALPPAPSEPVKVEEKAVREEADKLNALASKWAYVVPVSQFDRLTRRNDFYLKSLETVADASAPGGGEPLLDAQGNVIGDPAGGAPQGIPPELLQQLGGGLSLEAPSGSDQPNP